MIKQLRKFEDQISGLYTEPYNHEKWTEHIERIDFTARLVRELAQSINAKTVADLSCGDGAIVEKSNYPWDRVILGDICKSNNLSLVGPIEETIHKIDFVDLFVCSETLEHVKDPEDLLVNICKKSNSLIITTPHAEWDDLNWEHLWGWDAVGIQSLLDIACPTWECSYQLFTPMSNDYYTFQIWTCINKEV